MYMPVIDERKCDNCRACVRICPKQVFGPDEREVTVDNPTYCTGCDSCIVVCSEDAITVTEI